MLLSKRRHGLLGYMYFTLREESVCGRKNCRIYYCDRVLKKITKSWNLLLRWSTLDKS